MAKRRWFESVPAGESVVDVFIKKRTRKPRRRRSRNKGDGPRKPCRR